MTPEFAAGFNAGLEAARKVAITYPDNYTDPVAAHAELMTGARIASAISALTVPSDLVAVPREQLRLLLDYIPDRTIACHGDKCRYGWCESCYGDEYAEKQLAKAFELRAMIAATEERG